MDYDELMLEISTSNAEDSPAKTRHDQSGSVSSRGAESPAQFRKQAPLMDEIREVSEEYELRSSVVAKSLYRDRSSLNSIRNGRHSEMSNTHPFRGH